MNESVAKPKSILQQMREKQAREGVAIVQTEDGPALAPQSLPSPRVHTPDGESLGGGFTCLLPAHVETARELTMEWKAENWSKPSPWCSIEGEPNHPDFLTNLQAS